MTSGPKTTTVRDLIFLLPAGSFFRKDLKINPHTGALIIRIGFGGGHYTVIFIRNPQNSIGNYLGPSFIHGHLSAREADQTSLVALWPISELT